MKKILRNIIPFLAVALLGLYSCEKDPINGNEEPTIKVETLKISNDVLKLTEAQEIQLTASYTPAEIDAKTLKWSSSAEAVATVDDNGMVKAVAEGTAEIIVTLQDMHDTCVVTVKPHYDIDYTVMLYGCAGGNLDQYIRKNMNDAAKYGATDKVKMTALLKYSRGTSDSKATFYDLQDKKFTKEVIGDTKYNLGDPQHLTDFINKSKELYPANNYILIITNHGSEWESQYDRPVDTKAMVFDDNTNTALSIYGLAEGIKRSGERMSCVYPDICLFAMFATMNQLEGQADYVISSANTVIGSGGDYYALLKGLNSGKEPVENYKQYVTDVMAFWKRSLGGYRASIDVSLIDPSKLSAVYPVMTKFKNRFLEIQADPASVDMYKTFLNTQKKFYFFDANEYENMKKFTSADVLDAFYKISQATKDPVFEECYNELVAAIEEFRLSYQSYGHKGYVSAAEGFSFGIQWNMQNSYSIYGFSKSYPHSIFDKATKWSEFLKANKD